MTEPANLRSKVQQWIEKSGFSLEMSVAATLRGLDMGVVQSEYFEDPTTGAIRETDVVAFDFGEAGEDLFYLSFSLICECKTSLDRPWVLFSGGGGLTSHLIIMRMPATAKGRELLRELRKRKAARDSALFSIPIPKDVGYALTPALLKPADKGKDLAYEAVTSVTSATIALLAKGSENEEVTIAWPVVVLRGRLFNARLDAQGAIEVAEIEAGVLAWRNPAMDGLSIVHVVTEPAFKAWVESRLAGWRSVVPLAAEVLAATKAK